MGKAISIRTVSYVSEHHGLRPVSELTEPEQIQLAGELSLAFLNEFYKGKVVFSLKEVSEDRRSLKQRYAGS
ncbi:MAG: hypothetical protein VB023_01085 [Oscillibacter sp.]|nr:hypothetical protein [Oscillibacter sp.]